MSENRAVNLRIFTNSEQVYAQVEQHTRNRKCLKLNYKELLPRKATHLCLPLNSFIVQKLACVWRHV